MKTAVGQSIDWSKVTFIFCDERLVAFDDPESTFGLYMKLFKDTDIKEEQFLKVAVDLDVESAAKDYEDKLKAIMGDKPQADLLLLGKHFIYIIIRLIISVCPKIDLQLHEDLILKGCHH